MWSEMNALGLRNQGRSSDSMWTFAKFLHGNKISKDLVVEKKKKKSCPDKRLKGDRLPKVHVGDLNSYTRNRRQGKSTRGDMDVQQQ